MSILELFIVSFIIVVSFSLLILSVLAYVKNKNIKMLLISFVFLIFFAKVVIYNLSLYITDIDIFKSNTNMWIFDLFILLILYVASMKR